MINLGNTASIDTVGGHSIKITDGELGETITVDGLAYSTELLAGGLVTAPGQWVRIERRATFGLSVMRATEEAIARKWIEEHRDEARGLLFPDDGK